MPGLDRYVIANLESGRRRTVSIDEVVALAYVFNVAPVHLLALPEDTLQQVTPNMAVAAPEVFLWARGDRPLAGQDEARYLTESYATPAWEAFRDSLRAQAEADSERVARAVRGVDEEDVRRVVEPILRELAEEIKREIAGVQPPSLGELAEQVEAQQQQLGKLLGAARKNREARQPRHPRQQQG